MQNQINIAVNRTLRFTPNFTHRPWLLELAERQIDTQVSIYSSKQQIKKYSQNKINK
jgi:hypothetical protein